MLRTGWTDEVVLSRPHFSNKRKFDTYRAIDRLERVVPIMAVPIMSEEGGNSARSNVEEASAELFMLMGMENKFKATILNGDELPPDLMDMFEKHIGKEQLEKDGIIRSIHEE